MPKEVEQSATLWTSLYHAGAGVPDEVLAGQDKANTNLDIFNLKPDAEAVKAFMTPLNEYVYAVSVG